MKSYVQPFGKWALFILMMIGLPNAYGQKSQIKINSTIRIKASKAEVYKLIASLSRYPEWSPFLVKDPQQKNHVTGKDGQVGSVFFWEGAAEKSKGTQTLTTADQENYIRYDCNIEKPFKGNPLFEYNLKEVPEGTIVEQNFNLHLTRFNHLMTKMFGVKKKMTAINRLGLERLRELAEKESNLINK